MPKNFSPSIISQDTKVFHILVNASSFGYNFESTILLRHNLMQGFQQGFIIQENRLKRFSVYCPPGWTQASNWAHHSSNPAWFSLEVTSASLSILSGLITLESCQEHFLHKKFPHKSLGRQDSMSGITMNKHSLWVFTILACTPDIWSLMLDEPS